MSSAEIVVQEKPLPQKYVKWIGVRATLQGMWAHTKKSIRIEKIDSMEYKQMEKVGSLQGLAYRYDELDDDDGLHGIGWEYALKAGIEAESPILVRLLNEAIDECGPEGEHEELESVLWGDDKPDHDIRPDSEIREAVDTLQNGKLWTPGRGRPVELSNHAQSAWDVLNNTNRQDNLPQSARHLWKADLFIRRKSSRTWFAVSVKWKPSGFPSYNQKGISIGASAWQPEFENKFPVPIWDTDRKMALVEIPLKRSFGEGYRRGHHALMEVLNKMPRSPLEKQGDFLLTGDEMEIAQFLYEERKLHVEALMEKIDRIIDLGGHSLSVSESDIAVEIGSPPKLPQPVSRVKE